MQASASRQFTVEGPVDLALTLRQLNEGSKRTPEGMWWATNTPLGPGSVLLRREGATINAEAWGDGAEWMLDKAPGVIGCNDDPTTLPRVNDMVTDLARRKPGLRMPRSERVMEALFITVLGQKIQATMAHRSARIFRARYGQPAPGPCPIQLLPPTADIASMHYTDFHALGVERKRADVIINCAKRANRLEETADMSLEDAEKRLLAFPGIGPWTSGIIMQAALGDPDSVAVGDYHIPNIVSWALANEPRADDNRMLELLEPFAGHRGRVTLLLKFSGISAPKYGPRLELWSPAKL